jgi:hypothetical protein
MEIKNAIKNVVNLGKYYKITHYGVLYDEVREKLVEEEFEVSESRYIQYSNETNISWN